ncbi:snRNA-activating protein complex subunit 3-like [Hetaerina americana]|uniref:snRNA-activating protein complex subunit 3-like n=1 Tax=Hetaerina americana TaxID=62018 RepID=UPI003A7F39CF
MHKVYAPLDMRWVSKEFNPKTLLNDFNQKMDALRLHPSTPIQTMSTILDRAIVDADAAELYKSCSVDKFNCPAEPKVKPSTKSSGDSCISYPITEEGKSHLSTLRILSSSHGQYLEEDTAVLLPKKNRMCTNIRYGVKEPADLVKEVNLKPMQHLLLTVRLYHPFQQKYGSKRKMGPVLAQIINLLGEQSLTSLRDIIFCVNDYSVPGDRSENLDDEITLSNKELYPSGFFFIGDTFYNDMRHPLCQDYSKVIINWLQGLPGRPLNATSVPMENAKLEDLNLRLGYPYVYVHQGSCEHVVVFSDARLINSSDSLCAIEYPVLSYLYKKYSILCNFCGQYVSMWILHSCDRVPYSMVHLCERCLKMYCYKNKKKIGKFFLYEYIDPSSISPEVFTE